MPNVKGQDSDAAAQDEDELTPTSIDGGGNAAAVGQPVGIASLPDRLRAVYGKQVGSSERALLHSWMAFGATFATARAITHALRRRISGGGSGGSGGSGGIVIAGRHLHRYNLGILLLAAVGGVAVHGQEDYRQHPLTAAAFGSGGCPHRR